MIIQLLHLKRTWKS